MKVFANRPDRSRAVGRVIMLGAMSSMGRSED